MIDKVDYLEGDDGLPFIKILDEPYVGVCVCLGAVSFPDSDQPVMRFDYNIIDGSVDDIGLFEQHLGDFIVRLIQDRIITQSLLYTGGEDIKNI